MSNNSSVPGLEMPTQKAMLAGNPRDSAMQSMNNNAELQAQANKNLSGGRHRKLRGGAIPAPQMQLLYENQNGTGPNEQMKGNAQTSTQMAANAALDAGATKMGGSRRRRSRKGGNPDWVWGCMSGGKKRRTRKTSRKNKKSRKNKRSRKH
jgi:hypothetical protein